MSTARILDDKDVILFVESEPTPEATPSNDQDSQSPEDAFNPETGEINWDCPCIAGMTQPPCGEAFKSAFSCFVYSTTEPKGADCVEKFREMQACFAEHPDIYGKELRED
jgi:intermembrane space import and assembly protein 40